MKRKALASKETTEEKRLRKMQSIVQFFGKGLWKGDLSEMRGDHPQQRLALQSRRHR
jgi:hypothetical protein